MYLASSWFSRSGSAACSTAESEMDWSFPRLSVVFFSNQFPRPQPSPHPVPKDVQIAERANVRACSCQRAALQVTPPPRAYLPTELLSFFLLHCGRPVSESTRASRARALLVGLAARAAVFPGWQHRTIHPACFQNDLLRALGLSPVDSPKAHEL